MAAARIVLSLRPLTNGAALDRTAAALRDSLDALLAAGLIALFLVTFVIRTYYIPSISMFPTLRIHDLLLVDNMAYRFHTPQFGDVAVFVPPIDAHGDDFVKRVIGTPGDIIRISDGVVYRNGIALREPYVNQPPRYDLSIARYGIYVNGARLDPASADVPPRSYWQRANRIPQGFYFMLGDNRNYSDDSHVWGFVQLHGSFVAGALRSRNMRAAFAGRAFVVLWPLDRLKVVQ